MDPIYLKNNIPEERAHNEKVDKAKHDAISACMKQLPSAAKLRSAANSDSWNVGTDARTRDMYADIRQAEPGQNLNKIVEHHCEKTLDMRFQQYCGLISNSAIK